MGKPSLSSTLTVYFNVLDLNDNAPLFDPMSYSDEVFENVTAGTSVVTVSATDMDSGKFTIHFITVTITNALCVKYTGRVNTFIHAR